MLAKPIQAQARISAIQTALPSKIAWCWPQEPQHFKCCWTKAIFFLPRRRQSRKIEGLSGSITNLGCSLQGKYSNCRLQARRQRVTPLLDLG